MPLQVAQLGIIELQDTQLLPCSTKFEYASHSQIVLTRVNVGWQVVQLVYPEQVAQEGAHPMHSFWLEM